MAESLFRVFDEDNSGALNFFEYLQVNILDLEFLNSNIEAHIYLLLRLPDLHSRKGKYLCFYVLVLPRLQMVNGIFVTYKYLICNMLICHFRIKMIFCVASYMTNDICMGWETWGSDEILLHTQWSSIIWKILRLKTWLYWTRGRTSWTGSSWHSTRTAAASLTATRSGTLSSVCSGGD